METSIFDTVSEDDYDNLVARRRSEAQGFIVDDGGLGYGDEGEEEDWPQAGLPTSSDESDGGGDTNSKNRSKKSAAAASIMGKQRISSMFTSTVFTNKDRSLDCENIVDDVIAEFAPDDKDRARRRRGQGQLPVVKIEGNNNVAKNSKVNDELCKIVVNDCDNAVQLGQNCSVDEREGVIMEVKDEEEKGLNYNEKREDLSELKEEVAKIESENRRVLNAKISVEERDPALSAMADWKAVISGGNESVVGVASEEVKSGVVSDEQSEFELEDDGSFPFYIIDAHEEIFGANMGQSGKYITVAVRL